MRLSQDDVFADFEGNSWFERNRRSLESFDPKADLPLRLMELYNLAPRAALEVGAANGFRLAEIGARGARVVALEPSLEAIEDGKNRFPNVSFVQGEARAIPLKEAFDLIIVNFVFHWIDRENLFRSVAEIDRLLVDGGFLIIGDFFPSGPVRVRYHHLLQQEVFTYKQDYAALFLASGLYHSVCLLTGDHSLRALNGNADEDQRLGVWLLQKGLTRHYREVSLGS